MFHLRLATTLVLCISLTSAAQLGPISNETVTTTSAPWSTTTAPAPALTTKKGGGGLGPFRGNGGAFTFPSGIVALIPITESSEQKGLETPTATHNHAHTRTKSQSMDAMTFTVFGPVQESSEPALATPSSKPYGAPRPPGPTAPYTLTFAQPIPMTETPESALQTPTPSPGHEPSQQLPGAHSSAEMTNSPGSGSGSGNGNDGSPSFVIGGQTVTIGQTATVGGSTPVVVQTSAGETFLQVGTARPLLISFVTVATAGSPGGGFIGGWEAVPTQGGGGAPPSQITLSDVDAVVTRNGNGEYMLGSATLTPGGSVTEVSGQATEVVGLEVHGGSTELVVAGPSTTVTQDLAGTAGLASFPDRVAGSATPPVSGRISSTTLATSHTSTSRAKAPAGPTTTGGAARPDRISWACAALGIGLGAMIVV